MDEAVHGGWNMKEGQGRNEGVRVRLGVEEEK